MNFTRRRILHLTAGAAALQAVSHIARAQTYPSRPITLIVPFAAGGAADTLATRHYSRLSRWAGATCSPRGQDPIPATRIQAMGAPKRRKNPGSRRFAYRCRPAHLREPPPAPRRVLQSLPPISPIQGNPAACACPAPFCLHRQLWPALQRQAAQHTRPSVDRFPRVIARRKLRTAYAVQPLWGVAILRVRLAKLRIARMLEWDDLRCFLAFARAGGTQAAAKAC
jgi:hypothetical protein